MRAKAAGGYNATRAAGVAALFLIDTVFSEGDCARAARLPAILLGPQPRATAPLTTNAYTLIYKMDISTPNASSCGCYSIICGGPSLQSGLNPLGFFTYWITLTHVVLLLLVSNFFVFLHRLVS